MCRMKRRMKRSQRACAIGIALAAILGSIGSAPAEVYPSRPITMIVPYPAGGLFDALARILADPMRAALAQTVVIENVGGAGGSIAVGRVARAAPDGYTVAIGSADQFVVNAAIYTLPYDVVNDFEPVAAGDERSPPDRQQDRRPGGKSEGVDGMAEGKPCPGDAGP